MTTIQSAIQLRKPPPAGCEDVLNAGAFDFPAALARRCEPRRRGLLERRRARQAELDAGRLPDFLPETKDIRDRAWTVAPIPPDLRDRRVEITGPVDRKMMINGLNSGANVFMADFEDANAPTWENNVAGQQNLKDAVAGAISYVSPEGKRYTLVPQTATLFVRPLGRSQLRALGLHLQLHQEAAPLPGARPPRSRARHDGAAVPQELRRPGDPNLSSPRHSRPGRDGGADSHQARSGAQCAGARKGAPGQAARGAAGTRRHLGGASGPGGAGPRGVRRPPAGADPHSPPRRRRARHRAGPAGDSAGDDHVRGTADQPRCGGALSRGVAV